MMKRIFKRIYAYGVQNNSWWALEILVFTILIANVGLYWHLVAICLLDLEF